MNESDIVAAMVKEQITEQQKIWKTAYELGVSEGRRQVWIEAKAILDDISRVKSKEKNAN